MYHVFYDPKKDCYEIHDYDIKQHGAIFYHNSVLLYNKTIVADKGCLTETLEDALARANGNGRFDKPVYYHGQNINRSKSKKRYCYIGNVLCEFI